MRRLLRFASLRNLLPAGPVSSVDMKGFHPGFGDRFQSHSLGSEDGKHHPRGVRSIAERGT